MSLSNTTKAPDHWFDQYTDGKAAGAYEKFFSTKVRQTNPVYRRWLAGTLKNANCKTVLDCACGTGPDSIILVEEGFKVVSTDASDQMLKVALKERWDRRHEPGFDDWVIDEANWLTLADDLKQIGALPADGKFDAVLCLGGSLQHLPNLDGTGKDRILAMQNMMDLVKPGGLLVIDQRNYDSILATGVYRGKSVMNECQMKTVPSVLYVAGRPVWITTEFSLDAKQLLESGNYDKELKRLVDERGVIRFTLSCYPITAKEFVAQLKQVFGSDIKFETWAECKPAGQVEDPVYWTYIIHKPKSS